MVLEHRFDRLKTMFCSLGLRLLVILVDEPPTTPRELQLASGSLSVTHDLVLFVCAAISDGCWTWQASLPTLATHAVHKVRG